MEYLGTVSDQTMSSIDLRSIINEARQEHGEGFFASCFILQGILGLLGYLYLNKKEEVLKWQTQ